MRKKIIGHLDMDAFFAAIEERDKPRLKGKPIVVGADPKDGKGRGVVSTANYKARKYGIKSAMPISIAWRLAEEGRKRGGAEAVFIGGNYNLYGKVSQEIMDIVRGHVPHIEQGSIDEAYLDLTFAVDYEKAEAIAREIKREIREKEKLTCSIGIGPNKLIAKIASDRQKPDGLTIVPEEEAEAFLAPLGIRTIPGIGPKTEALLLKRKIKTVGDIRKLSREELEECLGKWGLELYDKARGKGDAEIIEEYEAKSIGEQETFAVDVRDPAFLGERLKFLASGIFERFRSSGYEAFKAVVLTVRFADFATVSRTHSLKSPANDRKTLEFEAMRLLLPFFDARENPKRKAFRLLGVRVEKLI